MLSNDLIIALDRELARGTESNLAESLVKIRVLLREAEGGSLDAIRSIAGVAIRALSVHGIPSEPLDLELHYANAPEVREQLADYRRSKALRDAAERLQAAGLTPEDMRNG